MVSIGRDLKDHLIPTPCHEQGHLPLHQVAQSSIQPGLEHFQGGPATASLGNLCQCFTTLMVKNFLLISHLNLSSFSLEPLPCVLSLHTLVKIIVALLKSLRFGQFKIVEGILTGSIHIQ